MSTNTNPVNSFSVSEASDNFEKLIEAVNKDGVVYLAQNGKPKYKLIDLDIETDIEMTDDEKIDFVAARILKKYRRAFEELAK